MRHRRYVATSPVVADTTPPTVVITLSDETTPTYAASVTATFTFSEAVAGFLVGDVTVGGGGNLSNFAGSGEIYTATWTFAAGINTLDIAGSVCQDLAGNNNTAATQKSVQVFTLLDQFTSGDTTNNRTCVPGPGTLTFGDSAQWTVTGGKLTLSGTASYFRTMALTRANGLAVGVKAILNGAGAGKAFSGIATVSTGTLDLLADALYLYTTTDIWNVTGAFHLESISSTTLYIIHVFRPRGTLSFIKGGGFADWTLILPGYAISAATVYATQKTSLTGANNTDWDDMNVLQLGAPFTTEFGYATDSLASASDGSTITMSADGFVLCDYACATNDAFDIMVRRTDDNNCWIVRVDQAGSTIKLIEKNGGTETERKTGAVTFTNGTNHQFIIKTIGNTIEVWRSELISSVYQFKPPPWTPYASASFNNTATGAKLSGKAMTNFCSLPRSPTGAALAELNKLSFT